MSEYLKGNIYVYTYIYIDIQIYREIERRDIFGFFLTKAEKRYNKELNHTYLSDHRDK